MAAPSDRLRRRSGVVADAAAAHAAAPGRVIHVLRNGGGEGGADRHGAGVGPASTLARPRPRLPGAPFGMDTRRSAPGPAAAWWRDHLKCKVIADPEHSAWWRGIVYAAPQLLHNRRWRLCADWAPALHRPPPGAGPRVGG